MKQALRTVYIEIFGINNKGIRRSLIYATTKKNVFFYI